LNKKDIKDLFIIGIVIIWILFFALHRSAFLGILLPTALVYFRDFKTNIFKSYKFILLFSLSIIIILIFGNLNIGSEVIGIINRSRQIEFLIEGFNNINTENTYFNLMGNDTENGNYLNE